MTRREMLAWTAVGLAAIAFTASSILNRKARAELSEAEGAERAASKLAFRLHEDCGAAFDFARSAISSPPGQHQRERALVAARAAQVCLDKEARAELREKVILLELSADQDMARDLALDVAKRTGKVIQERQERIRREEEEFERREREEIERQLRDGLR
jgi:hypothetical protein